MAFGFRAVVFDYGGVLSRPPTAKDRKRIAELIGIPVGEFLPLYAENRPRFDQGDCTPESYWNSIAARVGRRLDRARLKKLRALDIAMWSNLNLQMARWADRLRRAGIKTAILSNMQPEMARRLHQCDWPRRFDCVTLSCEIGRVKPDPQIYLACLQSLRVPATQVLFLDDKPANVEGARSMAMVGIQFQSVPKLRQALHNLRFDVLP